MVKIEKEAKSQYQYKLCNIIKRCSSELSRHVKGVHAKIRDQVCSICDRSFGYKESLERHVKLVHMRETIQVKDNFCHPCSKAFGTKWEFTNHTKSVHLKI